MLKKLILALAGTCLLTTAAIIPLHPAHGATVDSYQAVPPFVSAGVPPLVMMVMGRNHKLYYEAYNDASDLDGDGELDVGYKGYLTNSDGSDNSDAAIEYYGYFDSYKCYTYSGSRFEPSSVTTDKTCSGSAEWSGDWLNYMTMSRMDTMRKVLYGGYRSTDTATTTVLERGFIPQDAHSWGKEYMSITHDGYDIGDYTPLDLPVNPTGRHLFASTTRSATGDPLFIVLPNSQHRIWDWVAKERPVVDQSLEFSGGSYNGYPANHDEYEDVVLEFGTDGHRQGFHTRLTSGGSWDGTINGSGNPFGADEQYLTIFSGMLNITEAGQYVFFVDGDDAIELIIDGNVVAGYYGSHGACGCFDHFGVVDLAEGQHSIEFRHQEQGGLDNYYLYWHTPSMLAGDSPVIVPHTAFDVDGDGNGDLTQATYDFERPSSQETTYTVRVQVAVTGLEEPNCKAYPNGNLKPIGILQRHGEAELMYFGLITGSYANNTDGGVVRKNVSSIRDEINWETDGTFTTLNGIINTLDTLQVVDFDYGDYSYNPNWPGAWVVDRPMNDGEFPDWGNPVAEMMYESLRYFAGLNSPTANFTYSGGFDATMGLPRPSWIDPFDPDNNGFEYCARPFMLVLSDINPTYDSDSLPGSAFSSFSGDTLGGMNVASLANTIFTNELSSGSYYVGQQGTNYDGACTEKSLSGLGSVRGLCPEEPTKQGSYYSASVAYHGLIDPNRADDPDTDEDETKKRDIHGTAQSSQQVTTYAVGLASPLPRIEVHLPDGLVTLVPFAKSVGDNCGGLDVPTSEGQFQPTNTIVDFFVEEIVRDSSDRMISARFRINFEDVEQAADHDMDAIVLYDVRMVDSAGDPVMDQSLAAAVEVILTSEYAAGCIHQHIGYIISGTTADGTYLEVRDADEGGNNDYFLDTPPGVAASGDTGWNDDAPLPLQHSRTFTPNGSGTAAQLLPNPLYYAAKWGGFEDTNQDGIPNSGDDPADNLEWDQDSDGLPDTYFYVTNPLKLEEQLNASFAAILRRTSSGTAASVISGTRSGEGAIFQSIFYPQFTGQQGNAVSWIGQVHSLLVDAWGNMREDTNGNQRLDMVDDYVIRFDGTAIAKYSDSDGDGIIADTEETPVESGSVLDIDYLWSSSDYLNNIPDISVVNQRSYSNASQAGRHIITFADENGDMIVNPGEQVDFVVPNLPTTAQLADANSLYPYIPVHADSEMLPSYVDSTNLTEFLQVQTQRVVNYIRGADQGEYLLTSGTSATIPAFRSRQLDTDGDGTLETWRLGDIVYSTPSLVGSPSEALHLLYRDSSYADFVAQYSQRRNVIYVGGNDGMLHAFNGGFFEDRHDLNGDDEDDVAYLRQPMDQDGNTDTLVADFELGAELWAYVPNNLLPHLYWLTEENYPHVYYMDLKPRIFDAKIFADDTDHPHGWGTLLVAGMRFGGGLIGVDMNRTDGTVNGQDRTMGSAFVIMDITNPETAPTVLAEIRFPRLGYTTSYPTGLFMVDDDSNPQVNQWYLTFGSGPADSNGNPGSNATNALPDATSEQPAYMYVVNLNHLTGSTAIVTTVTSTASSGFGDTNAFAELDTNAFVSDPVAVDYNLDYATDAVYFGTVSGDKTNGWGGKMRRLVIDNDTDSANWVGDSVLLDLSSLEQPVTAAATPAIDNLSRPWVFFGTGRYFVKSDTTNADQQSYYGVREPLDSSTGAKTWGTTALNTLHDHTNVTVNVDGTLSGISYANFGQFETNLLNSDSYPGWFVDFSETGERNLGQAALLGGLLTFTTFVPDEDPCAFEGTSNLYALYYKSGTAYENPAIGTTGQTDNIDNDGDGQTDEAGEEGGSIITKTSLGEGMAITPSLHVGRADGSKAFIQTSTGAIEVVQQLTPFQTKSGRVSWEDRE